MKIAQMANILHLRSGNCVQKIKSTTILKASFLQFKTKINE